MDIKDFRVAVVRPRYDGDFTEPCEPLGAQILVAFLQKYGFNARVFDFQLPDSNAEEALYAFKPHLMGLSVMSSENVSHSLRLALKMREYIPDIVFAAGGLYVTTNYDTAEAKFPKETYLIRGEGELAFLRLCCKLIDKAFLETTDEFLTSEKWIAAAKDNFPEYERWGAPISLRTSRGCSGCCSFCATPSLPPPLNKWSGMPIENLLGEMSSAAKFARYPIFNFVDDDFGELSRIEELCEGLARIKLRAAFSLQLRAKAICERDDLETLLPKLATGGLCRVFVGIESTNIGTLKSWGKSLDPQETLRAMNVFKNAGIETHLGYILWHPQCDIKSVREEAEILWKARAFTTKTAVSRLVLFPGSALSTRMNIKSDSAIWAPIHDEKIYARIASLIDPLYKVWVHGATALPRAHCLAFLTGNPKMADIIRSVLSDLDKLSYKIITGCDVNEKEIEATAEKGREELYAIGCAGITRK